MPRCIEWWQLLLVAEFICLMNRYNENRHLVQNMSVCIVILEPYEYGRAPSGGFQTTGDDFKTGDGGSGLEPLMIRATHMY